MSEIEIGALSEAVIVLVEDDDGDAKAVRRAFKSARIANRILRMTDGEHALRFLRNQTDVPPPRRFVLLVDINMPRMNGHEFVAALRCDPLLKRSVVFMLTTSRDPKDIHMAYDNNVAGYIVKEDAGSQFLELLNLVDGYWRLIELPKLDHPEPQARAG